MSGQNLHISLGNLSQYFHELDIGEVEELLERDLDRVRKKNENQELSNAAESEGSDDDECLQSMLDPKIYSKLTKAMQGYDCIDLLQEIYNDAVCARKETGFKENDSWEFLAKVVNKEKYMGFIYSLVHLWELDPTAAINRKLSFNAARTYLYLLTTPGAKSCEIFDEDLVQRCFGVFNILSVIRGGMQRKIRGQEEMQILLLLVSLLEDLTNIFKIVSLTEFKDLKKDLIKQMKSVILHNHINGYESICK